MSEISDIAKSYLERARNAQLSLSHLSQKEVDEMAFFCGKAIYDHAEVLSQLAVSETGLGNVADKIMKKKAKSEATWAEIKDKKTVGIIKRDDQKRLIFYADPVGVVAGVAPCTNPIVTAMFYTMICIKTRNSLIISPHPRAIESTKKALFFMKEAISFANISEDFVQIIDEPNLSGKEALELSSQVMSMANLVIATGGPKLVDVAYHSGTPAYGVGAGNTPVYIHPSANIEQAVRQLLFGRAFDNGIICASEQHLLVPEEIYSKVEAALETSGAYLVNDSAEQQQLSKTIFDEGGHIKPNFLGKDVAFIAEKAGLTIPKNSKVLIVPTTAAEIGKDPYTGEKLCPILSLIRVKSFSEAIEVAESLLNYQGRGHTAAIHIDEVAFEKDLLNWAERLPATHIIVNMPSATSSGGSPYNWLTASTTLGCGAYGGTMPMSTINLTVDQLLNYKAVAMPLAKRRIPENCFANSTAAGWR